MTRALAIRGIAVAIGLAAASASWSQTKVVELYDGLDPVELLAGREIPGDDAVTGEHNGYKFLFANAANRAVFAKDPERYEPANGGSCARMGLDTRGLASLYVVLDGRIYLFGSSDCHKAFTANPSKYIEQPAPAPVVNADARTRGRALADGLARAIGGSKLTGVTSFQQVSQIERKGPRGLIASDERLLVQLPNNVRFERAIPFGTAISAVTGDDVFSIFMRKEGPAAEDSLSPPARTALATALKNRGTHSLLSIFKGAISQAADVAAMDPPDGADRSLGYLHLRHGGANVMLGLDPLNQRPRVIRYRARSSEGAFATIVLELEDYREIEGLWLPYAVRGTADGAVDAFLTYTVTRWTLNPPITGDTFARPPRAPGAAR